MRAEKGFAIFDLKFRPPSQKISLTGLTGHEIKTNPFTWLPYMPISSLKFEPKISKSVEKVSFLLLYHKMVKYNNFR
jgi:hypothetical protein